MEQKKALFDYDSLMFFGRVNASISHELKNIMAIISETAGLLGDLAEMASTGTVVDHDMLKTSADSIMEEIQRGFVTIRQMNRFSHSVDVPVAPTDLMALLDLVCRLSNYLAFSGKTHLVPWDGPPPIAQTCPFILQAIVYEVVVRHFKHAGPAAELEISIRPQTESGWQILFAEINLGESGVFPDDQLTQSAASIAVNIEWAPHNDQLALQVPMTIQPGAGDGEATDRINGIGAPSIRVESI